jgi:hypothetical protein
VARRSQVVYNGGSSLLLDSVEVKTFVLAGFSERNDSFGPLEWRLLFNDGAPVHID